MMRRAAIVSLTLALAACGEHEPPAQPAEPEIAATDMTCAAFAGLTPDALAERFGAANITTQTLPGAEGEAYEATIVLASDPARRFEVVWNEARTAIASTIVNTAGTTWRGPEGMTIGSAMGEVERANVMTFTLWGFGWDYGGWVSDWNLGVFSQTPGCSVSMRFEPRREPGVDAMGDREFMSNDPNIRTTDPAVVEFGLRFDAP